MAGMYYWASAFDVDLNAWDAATLTQIEGMFYDTPSFDAGGGGLNGWDVASVNDMGDVFFRATRFNGDCGNWDTSSVRDTSSMFNSAEAMNADISAWNVAAVTNMIQMFEGAIVFNADLSDWDVSLVELRESFGVVRLPFPCPRCARLPVCSPVYLLRRIVALLLTTIQTFRE